MKQRELVWLGVGLLVCVVARGQFAAPLDGPDDAYAAAHARLTALLTDPMLDPDVRDTNLPLAALDLERYRRSAGRYWTTVRARGAWLDAAAAALDRCQAGDLPYPGQTGALEPDGCLERAYLCRTDGSPQPYYVRLPDDYDPGRQYPMVVFLHGYVTDTSIFNPWLLGPSQWRLAADRDLILVLPHGRSNTDFLGIGEIDVLRVIEEMQRFYSIDPDRIHLSGTSMGGYGAWAIGLRHPSMFASLSAMAGQSDFFLWERRARDEVAYKTWCIAQNNPLDLAANALHLPLLVQHGELDHLVPSQHSQIMVARLRELSLPVDFEEYEGQGHYIYWEDEPFARVFDFVADKVRETAPATIDFRTFTPRQGQAYWLDVRGLARWGPAGEVQASIANDQLQVTTANLAELVVDPPAALRGAGLQVVVDGVDLGALPAGPALITWPDDGPPTLATWTPDPSRPNVGPAREVFNRPVTIVIASGNPTTTPANTVAADLLASIWAAFAEGTLTPRLDTDLSAAEAAAGNLVVCGDPADVRLAAWPAAETLLPAGIAVTPDEYQVGTRRLARGVGTPDELGLSLLMPHPLAPDALVWWRSGADYGAGLPLNHQFDLLPDLLVYGPRRDWDGTNRYLLGGFLSPHWQLDEAALDVAPELRGE